MFKSLGAVNKTKSQASLMIFIAWLVYSTSYLGKVNYSANITQIMTFYNVSKAEAGLVPTFFFFAYGIGQVVNGILCKYYNKKWFVFLSLAVSSVVNIIIAISNNFAILKWLWLFNGFALSILWPTLISSLSAVLPKKQLGKSSVVMGTTVAVGTLVIYGLSSIFALFNGFKLAFYTASIIDFVVACCWLIFYKKATTSAKQERDLEDNLDSEETDKKKVNPTGFNSKNEKKMFFISVGVICFCAIGVNLIKDGLTTWVPSILKEEYQMHDSLSILLTLTLPIIAVFGNAFALKMHGVVKDYVTHLFLVFAVMALFIGGIIGSLSLKFVLFMLIGLVVVNFLASSLNSLITSIFPMFMREKVNSGLFAGVLNGFAYVGSTISSYGLGLIADNFGWTMVFWTLILFCALVILVYLAYMICKKVFSK